MTYVAHHRDFVPYFPYQTSTGSNAVTNKAGVLRRIVDAIFESPQKQTDREIARLKLETMGHRLDKLTAEQEQYLASWQEGT